MTTHVQARAMLVQGWGLVFPERVRTTGVSQALQSVACLESGYGIWHGAMAGSNNVGCLQCAHVQDAQGKCPPGCAPATDTNPTPTGKDIAYGGCFKVYPTPQDGFTDLVRWFVTRQDALDAADRGDGKAFSTSLYDHSYYRGHGATRDARIANHLIAVMHWSRVIAPALDEALCLNDAGDSSWTPAIPGV